MFNLYLTTTITIIITLIIIPQPTTSVVDFTVQTLASGTDVVYATLNILDFTNIFPNDKGFMLRVAWVSSSFGTNRNYIVKNGLAFYGGIWQINETIFESTKSSTLLSYHQQLQTYFGFDWNIVEWKDLLKPLYSAIATRLYLIGKYIPDTIADQAKFWVNNFDNSQTSNYFITSVASMPLKRCTLSTDIIYVLDGSASINVDNFKYATSFLSNMTSVIYSSSLRIGFVLFSSYPSVIFSLDNILTEQQISNAIINVIQPKSGTDTASALLKALDMFNNAISRPGVPRSVIVITDGGSNDPTATAAAAQQLRNLGVINYVIGVGNQIVQSELNNIAGTSGSVRMIGVWGALEDFENELFRDTCSLSQKPIIGVTSTYSLSKGESIYFQFSESASSSVLVLTLKFTVGVVDAYYSQSFKLPSEAIHDGSLSEGDNPMSTNNVYVAVTGVDLVNRFELTATLQTIDKTHQLGGVNSGFGFVLFGVIVLVIVLVWYFVIGISSVDTGKVFDFDIKRW